MSRMMMTRRQSLSAGAASAAALLLPAATFPAQSAGLAAPISLGPIRAAALIDHQAELSPQDLIMPSGALRPTTSDLASPVVTNYLRFRNRNVLIGTGSGGRLGQRSRLIDGLAAHGLAPADIDLILLTHLHPEHVGGLIETSGTPIFAKATVVCCRTEWRWWNTSERPAGLPERYLPFVDLARSATRPYEQAGRLVTFTGTEVVAPGITGFPALGHTAGHSLFLLEDNGSTVLTLGDVLHAAALQLSSPGIGTRLDVDPGLAADTRRSMLGDAADMRYAVVGNHVALAGARVVRKGSGFELTSA